MSYYHTTIAVIYSPTLIRLFVVIFVDNFILTELDCYSKAYISHFPRLSKMICKITSIINNVSTNHIPLQSIRDETIRHENKG